ncbi:hypothetical protein [Algoriphagus sp. Y33]|uniref:hypothetical protein n=1 Tax=Algoriphagus sp. Y33 TaxID=2772483 RepID=UPI00177E79E6|nr:hypothetical protein [Algoriphagus sp. Y33]
MSCFKSASAKVVGGITGPLLIVKVNDVPSGIVPPTLKKGNIPYDPKNVFPVIISNSVPGSTSVNLEITQNLTDENEFDFVELFCGEISKTGTRIPIVKE